jgi:hypothetical protein
MEVSRGYGFCQRAAWKFLSVDKGTEQVRWFLLNMKTELLDLKAPAY